MNEKQGAGQHSHMLPFSVQNNHKNNFVSMLCVHGKDTQGTQWSPLEGAHEGLEEAAPSDSVPTCPLQVQRRNKTP